MKGRGRLICIRDSSQRTSNETLSSQEAMDSVRQRKFSVMITLHKAAVLFFKLCRLRLSSDSSLVPTSVSGQGVGGPGEEI